MGPTRMPKLGSIHTRRLEFQMKPSIVMMFRDDAADERRLYLRTPTSPRWDWRTREDSVVTVFARLLPPVTQAHIAIEERIFGFGERALCVAYSWVDSAGKRGMSEGVDVFRVRNGSIQEKLTTSRARCEGRNYPLWQRGGEGDFCCPASIQI